MPKKQTIRIAEIEASAATQIRKHLDAETIDRYRESLKNGAILPPPVVFAEKGSERYILADGFHRVEAYKKRSVKEIEFEVRVGTLHDALVYALGANADHGLPRTPADNRNAVEMALKDPQLEKLSVRELSEVCRVPKSTVSDILRRINEAKDKRKGGTKSGKDKKGANGNGTRTTAKPPTQEQIDTDELMGAVETITGFAYGGEDAPDRMKITKPMKKKIDKAREWLESFDFAY